MVKVKKYNLKNAKKDLPKRFKTSNKTQGGKLFVIAGSKGMWGAAILTATAAARCGAGYIYLGSNSKNFPTVKHPDFLTPSRLDFSKASAVILGPGLKGDKFIKKLIKDLLATKIPVVLDAEGLNVLAKMKLKKLLPKNWILTPHEGELSRLLGKSSAAIRNNRLASVIAAEKKWGGVIVLKGYRSLVSSGTETFEVQSGNPALAKAGTGDVLAGMIGAFLSQKIPAISAASLGVFIHGFIADRWVQDKKDVLSLMASDLIDKIPTEIYVIRSTSASFSQK